MYVAPPPSVRPQVKVLVGLVTSTAKRYVPSAGFVKSSVPELLQVSDGEALADEADI